MATDRVAVLEGIAAEALEYLWHPPAVRLRELYARLGGEFKAEVDAYEVGAVALEASLLDRRVEAQAEAAREAEDRREMRRLRPVILARDGWRCCACGSDDDLTIDHIVPFSMGGAATEENLRTLCRSCNSSKGNRLAA